jgi:hypothetical protein
MSPGFYDANVTVVARKRGNGVVHDQQNRRDVIQRERAEQSRKEGEVVGFFRIPVHRLLLLCREETDDDFAPTLLVSCRVKRERERETVKREREREKDRELTESKS